MRENILSKRISAAGLCATYDEACKRILSNKQVLAWILKACVEEFKDSELKDIEELYIEGIAALRDKPVHQDERQEFIIGNNIEDATITEGTVTFDIRFRVTAPSIYKQIHLIMDIEAQNNYYPGYPLVKRGIYYGSRMISSQYGTEFSASNYGNIKKVYSVWICTNPPQKCKNTITRYMMREDLIIGNNEDKIENYDLINVTLICLGGSKYDNYEGVLKLLSVLLLNEYSINDKKRILEEEFSIRLTKEMEGDVSEMCNVSLGIWDEAWNKAWDECSLKTNLVAIQNMMESQKWTAESCMDILKIPEEKRKIYFTALEDAR